MEWYYDILFCSVYFLVDFTIFFLFILECSNFSNSQFYLINFTLIVLFVFVLLFSFLAFFYLS